MSEHHDPPGDDSVGRELDEILDDFLRRVRRGESPSIDEIIKEHPHVATSEIQQLFPAASLLEGALFGSREDHDAQRSVSPARVPPLQELGEYRIIRQIGHGGMGVVFEAEQKTLGRRVALKILPYHRLTDAKKITRFQREARAAAKLQHPNIVPVHGVGEHQGVHYYAMQFIPGQGLDAILEEVRRLRAEDDDPSSAAAVAARQPAANTPTGSIPSASPEGPSSGGASPSSSSSSSSVLVASSHGKSHATYHRNVALLGAQVARALAYSHGQEILHRDIKPSNLLLDGEGKPWITDFGLAKAVGSDDITRSGELLGTLRYMAPERFRGWADPRSDVYSLGLTLYELLTLRPAFDDPDEGTLIRRILEDEPTRPRRIEPEMSRDLETVVLKAIAKEPAERYETAEELAADLERFAAGEPIAARPSTVLDRSWKWAKRRPAAASLVAVVSLSLITVLAGSLWYNARLHASATHAESNFEKARGAIRKILVWVGEDVLENVPGMDRVREAILQEALRFYEDALEEEGHRPEVRFEAARDYATVAEIHHLLDAPVRAEAATRRSLELLTELTTGYPTVAAYRIELAAAYQKLGMLYEKDGSRVEDAEEAFRDAVRIARDTVDELGAGVAQHRALAHALNSLGLFLRERDPEEAEPAFRESLELHDQVFDAMPDDSEFRRKHATTLMNFSHLLAVTGHDTEARSCIRRAVEIHEELEQADQESREKKYSLALSWAQLANIERLGGRLSEAVHGNREAIRRLEWLVERFPAVPGYRYQLAATLSNHGVVFDEIGEQKEARTALEQARNLQEDLVSLYPRVPRYMRTLAHTLANLGRQQLRSFLRDGSGNLDEAKSAYRRSVAILEELASRDAGDVEAREALATVASAIAYICGVTGQTEEEESYFARSVGAHKELAEQFPKLPRYSAAVALTLNNRADVLLKKERYAEALPFLEEAVPYVEKARGAAPEDAELLNADRVIHWNLGRVRARLGDHAGARQAAERVRELSEGAWQGLEIVGEILTACAAAARADRSLEPGDRERLTADYVRSAKGAFEEVLAVQEPADGGDTSTLRTINVAGTRRRLATLLREAGELAEAHRLLDRAIEDLQSLRSAGFPEPSLGPELRASQGELVDVLLLEADLAEAVQALQASLEIPLSDPRHAFRDACRIGRTLGALDADRAAGVAPRRETPGGDLAASFAAQATDLLRHAVMAGYKKLAEIEAEPDLEPIRKRVALGEALESAQTDAEEGGAG